MSQSASMRRRDRYGIARATICFLCIGGVKPNSVKLDCKTQNQKFLCPLAIGSDRGPFYTLLDTASSITWFRAPSDSDAQAATAELKAHTYAPSTLREIPKMTDAFGHNHEFFTTTTSSTSSLMASGPVVQDTLRFGGLSIQNAYFGAANVVKGFDVSYLAGLAGFGFTYSGRDTMNSSDLDSHPSTWEALLADGHLDQPCFSVDASQVRKATIRIGQTDAGRLNKAGYLDLGTHRNQGKWSLPAVTFRSNSMQLGDEESDVILDTASGLYLPDHVVDAYYQQISNQSAVRKVKVGLAEQRRVRCDLDMPDLEIQLNRDISQRVLIPGELLKTRWLDSKRIGWCQGGIQKAYGQTNYTLGGPFFRAQYVEFCSYSGSNTTFLNDRLHISKHSNYERGSQVEFDENLLDIGMNDRDVDSDHVQTAQLNQGLEDLALTMNSGSPSGDSMKTVPQFASVDRSSQVNAAVLAAAQGVANQLHIGPAPGASGLNYGPNDTDTALARYTTGPERQLGGLRYATSFGQSVDRSDFDILLDAVQQDMDSGKLASTIMSSNYTLTIGSLRFFYSGAPGKELEAVAALNNAVGLMQWSRIDGMHNYFTWPIYRERPTCVSVITGVHQGNSTMPDVPVFGTMGCPS